ncbi:C-type lectin domain family 10 member A-like [Procambarus clarkii]|uniref:C-type lectin domain family 10 member A-like n=1 Tax=Procambarus clarkii TaxID=6728 RepID=UPI0037433741
MARLCYIVAMIMLSLASASACTAPFTLVGGGCYYFEQTLMLWEDARDYCRSLVSEGYSTDLAVVHSCDQLGAIWEHVLIEYGERVTLWIGGTDTTQEGSWKWVNGDTVPSGVPYWTPNRPIVDDTRNHLALHSDTGYFIDNGGESLWSICEQTSLLDAPKEPVEPCQ